MAPIMIFQVLFLIAACVGLFGVISSKPWGVAVGLGGLIMFCLVLLIGGR
jgi:hypothetical protein